MNEPQGNQTEQALQVSQLELEQYVLGEIPEDARPRVEAWLQTEQGRSRLSSLTESNAALLEAHPPSVAAADIKRQIRLTADSETARTRRWAVALALAVGAAAVLIMWWQWPGETLDSHSTAGAPDEGDTTAAESKDPKRDVEAVPEGALAEVTREKGLEPRITIHRKEGDSQVELSDGDVVQARDLLQVTYVPAGKSHGVIVSIDGRGVVTLHYPSNPNGETSLSTHKTPLANSYQLDDAPRFERFFFVTSNQPIDVASIEKAAHIVATGPQPTRAHLGLPESMEQTSVTLRKR